MSSRACGLNCESLQIKFDEICKDAKIKFSAFKVKAKEVTQKVIDYTLPKNEITGRREIRVVPTWFENNLGSGLYDDLCPKDKISKDDFYNREVKAVFDSLVSVCPRKNLQWEVRVLKDDETINAFCLPGGKVVITTALLKKLQENHTEFDGNDNLKNLTFRDNIAAVLGHEIIHAAAGHGARKLQLSVLLWGIGTVMGVALPRILFKHDEPNCQTKRDTFSFVFNLFLKLATTLTHCHHGQAHELESDKHGIEHAHNAGFNIHASERLQRIFLKMKNESNTPTNLQKVTEMFGSHPPSRKRLEANIETISAILRTRTEV